MENTRLAEASGQPCSDGKFWHLEMGKLEGETAFLAKHGNMVFSKPSFSLLTGHLGQEGLHLGSRNLFQWRME